MIELFVFQVAQNESNPVGAGLVVAGVILVLGLIKAFANHVGRWDGEQLEDIRDGGNPKPIGQGKRRDR